MGTENATITQLIEFCLQMEKEHPDIKGGSLDLKVFYENRTWEISVRPAPSKDIKYAS